MLLLSELRSFNETWAATRPNIENEFTVASDDEAGKLYKDTANASDACTLICVVPSHDPVASSVDEAKFNNLLTYMFVKKTDSRASNNDKLDVYEKCQLEVLAFVSHIKALIEDFNADCLFKDIDLNSIKITPINNYFNGVGYMMDLTTKTQFI